MGWYIAGEKNTCEYCQKAISKGDKIYFVTDTSMAHSLCFWDKHEPRAEAQK